MKSKFIIAIIIILSVVTISGVIMLFWSSYVPTSNILITSKFIDDATINLHVTFSDSALVSKWYSLKYNNGELRIKIKHGLVSFSKNKEIDISISRQDYKDIRKIYLEGKESSDIILLWQSKP